MTRTIPRRLMILHFSHRTRTEGRTFIIAPPLSSRNRNPATGLPLLPPQRGPTTRQRTRPPGAILAPIRLSPRVLRQIPMNTVALHEASRAP